LIFNQTQIGTSPVKQWIAQAIGTFFAIWIAPGLFVLFTSAYPCIYDASLAKGCPFMVPSVSAWAAVAQAVTVPNIPIPLSSGIFAVVMGVVSIIQAIVRHKYLVGDREKYREWLPNWGAIALSWVIPAPVFANAALIGAVAAAIWRKYNYRTWEIYGYAIAAGTFPLFFCLVTHPANGFAQASSLARASAGCSVPCLRLLAWTELPRAPTLRAP